MRLTVFWERMNGRFGEVYADSVVRDVTIGELGGRTAQEALDAGVPAKQVWLALCEFFEIPAKER
ncbi:MAG TPA: DUF3046 domain-containing protein [Mycobacteriales bacterium]|nr:DUF3046 domain-containing protein [Mycobacteriales bacterium]